MKVVWHGSYPLYFEDALEDFGKQYGLGYEEFIRNYVFAPLVELSLKYKKPLLYGQKARVDIVYQPTESAKIVFEYEIHDAEDDSLIAEGRSVQVFMDMDYQLVLENPPFYQDCIEKWKVL